VAAVELLNLLRPTVAVARYVTFAALALHQHPEWRERLQAGGEETAEQFVQEVRRFYPFFPFVGGRARTAFEWRGATIPARRWVLLDLYGTNHDPRAWHRPEAFNPDRFEGWRGDPYTLIPQGGGDHLTEHRCAGEWATVRLMHVALAALTQWMDYEVPSQDLTVSRSRMPTLPKSGFKMRSVRPRGG
jgi:fatty-acid peroxygenase